MYQNILKIYYIIYSKYTYKYTNNILEGIFCRIYLEYPQNIPSQKKEPQKTGIYMNIPRIYQEYTKNIPRIYLDFLNILEYTEYT